MLFLGEKMFPQLYSQESALSELTRFRVRIASRSYS